jgi:hypothetical protein
MNQFEESELLYCLALMLSKKLTLPIQVILYELTTFESSTAYVSKQLNLSIEQTISDCIDILKVIKNELN